ncbi:MAG TPA: A/G-specific adenine glycosylase [Candidatus Dorea merdavium]|nr:A/G-specific adenine glycosylase [Candidatus Dorea merdavium]
MRYHDVREARFLSRPNRFIAHVELDGKEEVVHVKNTGRCRELLTPGARVWLEEGKNPDRKTRWDLIAVLKGDRLINMDSQAPNQVAREWLEAGGLFPRADRIQPEYTYGNSRFDLYAEAEGRKILMEVKGVTLEEEGVVRFPDAPSQRAVKHLEELVRAREEGYETYVFFVIQMKDVKYFTPNRETHPEFAQALERAAAAGVKILAYDCRVEPDRLEAADPVPVVLGDPIFYEMREPLIQWYRENRRDLPWRRQPSPYHVWVSEIMLQQTRVEAVKPYYQRFLSALPGVRDLAEVPEDQLLKLWEGLGYYNRVRNMQKAARQVMADYGGEFPVTYEGIRSLAGIGSYTAGAIASFAYGLPKPAVDGNVLRVIMRLTGDDSDIMKQSTKRQVEENLEPVIPADAASDFNQGLIELGALVCVPNGQPKCEACPLARMCRARMEGRIEELPVKTRAKERRIEERTILVFRDGEKTAIGKRPDKGLLAGMYELPNYPGHMSRKEVAAYSKEIGLMPVRIKKLPEAKHIFSHVEWHMTGYEVRVDELEKTNEKGFLFIHPEEIQERYPIPAAFGSYLPRS